MSGAATGSGGTSRSAAIRHAPWRDIVWTLAFKAAALTLLYLLFFGPSHRIAVTPDRVAALLIPLSGASH